MINGKKYKVSVYDKKAKKFVEYNNPNVQNVNKRNEVSTYKISRRKNMIGVNAKIYRASIFNSGKDNLLFYDSNTKHKISNYDYSGVKFNDKVFMKKDDKTVNRTNKIFAKMPKLNLDSDFLKKCAEGNPEKPNSLAEIVDNIETIRELFDLDLSKKEPYDLWKSMYREQDNDGNLFAKMTKIYNICQQEEQLELIKLYNDFCRRDEKQFNKDFKKYLIQYFNGFYYIPQTQKEIVRESLLSRRKEPRSK